VRIGPTAHSRLASACTRPQLGPGPWKPFSPTRSGFTARSTSTVCSDPTTERDSRLNKNPAPGAPRRTLAHSPPRPLFSLHGAAMREDETPTAVRWANPRWRRPREDSATASPFLFSIGLLCSTWPGVWSGGATRRASHRRARPPEGERVIVECPCGGALGCLRTMRSSGDLYGSTGESLACAPEERRRHLPRAYPRSGGLYGGGVSPLNPRVSILFPFDLKLDLQP
jgi:hypothetical protein